MFAEQSPGTPATVEKVREKVKIETTSSSVVLSSSALSVTFKKSLGDNAQFEAEHEEL